MQTSPFLSGRLIPDPSLLYWVQLNTHEGPMVQVNTIGAEPLLFIQNGQNGATVPLDEQPSISPGLLFTVTRADGPPESFPYSPPIVGGHGHISPLPGGTIRHAPIVVVSHVGISPLPTGFPRRFRLVADFDLSANIDLFVSDHQWAAVVGIRSNNNPDSGAFKLAGAGQQIRILATDPDPGLNVALGAGSGTTAQVPLDLTDLTKAYPDAQRQFTLETDIDLDLKRGWSRLKTPGKIFSEISWQFDATKFPQIAGVGFGLAYAKGSGSASVTATAFRIYRLAPPPPPMPPIEEGTLHS